MSEFELKNQVAMITGASQGIGRGIAKVFAQSRAKLVLVARNQDKLRNVVEEIRSEGGEVIFVVCDVTSLCDMQTAVQKAIDAYGKIDILVNNAGTIDPIAKFLDSDPSEWAKAISVNVMGVYHGIRLVAEHMRKQGSGKIINMSSGAANSALEGWSHYCSSKAAVKKLTECANKELQAFGIDVFGLSPGTVHTELIDKVYESKLNPVSRLDPSVHISTEWVGRAVRYLCSEDAKEFAGSDFSIKTEEGRRRAGLI